MNSALGKPMGFTTTPFQSATLDEQVNLLSHHSPRPLFSAERGAAYEPVLTPFAATDRVEQVEPPRLALDTYGNEVVVGNGSPIGRPLIRMSGADDASSANASGRFSMQSSLSRETKEVRTMLEAYQQGIPILLYELVQGMVDYGEGHTPPPRIYIQYEDGAREVFRGDGSAINGRRIVGIEFRNTGPGLHPDNTVVFQHEGDGDTLGTHGRGLSVALAALKLLGMDVHVHSHYEGKPWEAVPGLSSEHTGRTPVMTSTGQWLPEGETETVITVKNPDEQFVRMLEGLPNHFIYANARFPGAVVVDHDPEAPPLSLGIDVAAGGVRGRIACLAGVVGWDYKRGGDACFVDGLKLKAYGSRFLFPWYMRGWQKASYPYHVSRGIDSSRVEGEPEKLVALALRRCTDPEILRILINISVRSRSNLFLPAELSPYAYKNLGERELKLDATTAFLLKGIWEEMYPDTLIVDDPSLIHRARTRGKQAVVVWGNMYDMLRRAGIECPKEAKIPEKFVSTDIEVPYARHPDCLVKLIREAAECKGEVEAFSWDGETMVQVSFPYPFLSDDDLKDWRRPGLQWTRIASVVAAEVGLKIGIGSVEPSRRIKTEIMFNPSRTLRFGRYSTPVRIHSTAWQNEDPDAKAYTVVTLAGDPLQLDEPPPSLADHLVKIASEMKRDLVEEEANRIAALPKVPARLVPASAQTTQSTDPSIQQPEPQVDDRESPTKGGGQATQSPGPAIGNHSTKSSLGVWKINYREAPSRTRGERRTPIVTEATHKPRFESLDPNRSVAGYYEMYSASILRIEEGRAVWHSFRDFEPAAFAPGGLEAARTVVRLPVYGEALIPIRLGEVPVYATRDAGGGDVRILRERNTGYYIVRGKNREVEVYTAPAQGSLWNTTPPTDEDSEPLVVARNLPPDWKRSNRFVQKHPGLSLSQRAAIAMYAWGSKFRYRDDPALDEQVRGETVGEVVAKIMKKRRGICNIAAAGMVGGVRSFGVPTRDVTGYDVDENGRWGHHAWVAFWDGTSWIPLEPQRNKFRIYRNVKDLGHPRLLSNSRSLITTDILVSQHFKLVEWSQWRNSLVSAAKFSAAAATLAAITLGGYHVFSHPELVKPAVEPVVDRAASAASNEDLITYLKYLGSIIGGATAGYLLGRASKKRKGQS